MNIRPATPTLYETMRCDGVSRALIGCLEPVAWGVRIHVPSRTQLAPDHAQVRMTTTLMTCHTHKGVLKLDDVLSEKMRADIEAFAKKARPIDWKPDFEAAFIQYVDVYGDEYKRFVAIKEARVRAAAEQMWGGPIARD